MKFAVIVNGKKYPVSVMREPKDSSALSNFDCEGRTYKGLPSQFNDLKLDKTKKGYTATSVNIIANYKELKPKKEEAPKVIEVETIIHIEDSSISVEESEELIPTLDVEKSEELEQIPEVTEEQLLEVSQELEQDETTEDEQNEKEHFLNELQQTASILNKQKEEVLSKPIICSKKLVFQNRWSYLFPEEITYAEGLFEKHKHIWIKLNGSEHLKIAHNMNCKCDSLYIQERAKKEFPSWKLNELLVYYEIDSPDFGILTFLKGFKDIYRDIFNSYHSRVLITTTEEVPDEDNPTIVIADYLGHSDLSISLVDLVELYGDRC